MPSSSRIRVSVRAHSSSSRCQSALLRASRETSRPRTMPCASHPDLGDQAPDALAVGRGAGLAEIGVDDDHAVGGASRERRRALAARTGGGCSRRSFEHLAQGGLAARRGKRGARRWAAGDLLGQRAHAASPGRCARIMSKQHLDGRRARRPPIGGAAAGGEVEPHTVVRRALRARRRGRGATAPPAPAAPRFGPRSAPSRSRS